MSLTISITAMPNILGKFLCNINFLKHCAVFDTTYQPSLFFSEGNCIHYMLYLDKFNTLFFAEWYSNNVFKCAKVIEELSDKNKYIKSYIFLLYLNIKICMFTWFYQNISCILLALNSSTIDNIPYAVILHKSTTHNFTGTHKKTF